MTKNSGQNIFITGAASGIGAATARLFAGLGWQVGLADRDAEALKGLASELGAEAQVFPLDVLDHEALKSALTTFSGPEGTLAALFNSAGILDMRPFAETPLERHYAMLDINVKGVIASTLSALPFLKAHGDARVITMSSAAANYGVPDLATYSASKCAVRGLTEAINIELEKDGVWACDIAVGYVQTPMLSEAESTAKSVEIVGVHVTPEMVAETVKQAVSGRQLHWFVREDDRDAADIFDATPREERRELIRPATGY